MIARLAVGRVEPWELVLSLGLLIATVPLVLSSRSASTRPACCSTGSRPRVRASCGRSAAARLPRLASSGPKRRRAQRFRSQLGTRIRLVERHPSDCGCTTIGPLD